MTQTKLTQEQILANIRHSKALRAKQIAQKSKRDPNFKVEVSVTASGERVWTC